ncbi:MAG TPA: uridine diphosphate-N-acetylglucosamine-binding protein YvcK [Candidatus Faecalicoccus intestinipullorum]|nr:uridine diphosphate-N-acetylglucosamine-binding protein YvcK [Candidatus Faecalicoccus intestinipullorum]
MKNIVVIGGGTGLSSMLMGMKKIENVNLTAIVTVADDGGSTGRIRDIYNVPAVGDIRHVLCAMATDDEDHLFSDLMNYRFEGKKDIGGHNLGNLIFLALMNLTGSFIGAIQAISKVLKVNGTILPSTLDIVTLYAMMKDGTLVRGEKNIPTVSNSIDHVFYQRKVTPYLPAIQAIEEADLLIYGIGSLYTSIMPNLIIQEISEAIQKTTCPHIYFCNAMSQPGETDNYSMEDHIRAIEKHSFAHPVDRVIVDQSYIPQSILDRYAKMGSYPIQVKEQHHDYQILSRNLIYFDEKGRIRHDPQAVKQVAEEILRTL